jgi:predicted DNA-binding transcriptional regulator AlpA
MSNRPGDGPAKYLRTKEAARVVGLCSRTLEKHRTYGTGPRYAKIGGRVLYDIDDLRAWIESAIRHSTSDAAAPLRAAGQAARSPRAGLCRWRAPPRFLIVWVTGMRQILRSPSDNPTLASGPA